MFNNIKTDIEQYRSFGYPSKKSQMYRNGEKFLKMQELLQNGRPLQEKEVFVS